MVRSTLFNGRVRKEQLKGFFFIIPLALAFITSIFILVYVSSTSKLIINHTHLPRFHIKPSLESSSATINNILPITPSNSSNHFFQASLQQQRYPTSNIFQYSSHDDRLKLDQSPPWIKNDSRQPEGDQRSTEPPLTSSFGTKIINRSTPLADASDHLSLIESSPPSTSQLLESQRLANGKGNDQTNNKDVFHDKDIFHENYKEMNKSLKIFIYPHGRNHPFANVLLPVSTEPGGNYASESYFKKSLAKSHFVTDDPSQADLFYLPFSIASLRHDKRIGVGGIKDFVKDYVYNISHEYPYWNRTGGSDHFYVACHSIGRTAMEKAVEVRINAIQVVCSSSYFVPGYIAHKDASIPQIWPRHGTAPTREPSKRNKLAFYAGALNSRVREYLVQVWSNDSEISVHHKRLQTPYSESILNSKYCIHAKGYEVNTARIGDALYYGCVPVILADHYDLPFADILDWSSFSVVVSTSDIPFLKKILKGIDFDEYLRLQSNVLKVRNHFQWHSLAVDYDSFYMVMYELWLRRSSLRFRDLSSLDRKRLFNRSYG